MVRQRLESTEPVDFEGRPAFVARLRRCVNWLNESQGDALLTICTNQKLRAKDVIDLEGGRDQVVKDPRRRDMASAAAPLRCKTQVLFQISRLEALRATPLLTRWDARLIC